MPRTVLFQGRHRGAALVGRQAAARREAATRRQVEQRWHHALDLVESGAPAVRGGVEMRDRAQETLRVGMAGIVEQIRRRIEDKPIREPYLKSGERVVLTFDGSFSGIEAIFLSSVGEERVLLLLNILQSEQALIVPVKSVRKLARKTCLG